MRAGNPSGRPRIRRGFRHPPGRGICRRLPCDPRLLPLVGPTPEGHFTRRDLIRLHDGRVAPALASGRYSTHELLALEERFINRALNERAVGAAPWSRAPCIRRLPPGPRSAPTGPRWSADCGSAAIALRSWSVRRAPGRRSSSSAFSSGIAGTPARSRRRLPRGLDRIQRDRRSGCVRRCRGRRTRCGAG
jgi:hypothetical protein